MHQPDHTSGLLHAGLLRCLPVAFALSCLSACQSPLPPKLTPAALDNASALAVPGAIQPISLQGQLSIKLQAWNDTPAKGVSLGFFFLGTRDAGQLDLMTPLGSQMARLAWQQSRVTLTDTQGEQQFDSLDALSEQTLGEALPLRALVDWMQGKPCQDLPYASEDSAGVFSQAGWRVDTSHLTDGKLTVQRAASLSQRGVMVKIFLDR